jgi:hypothetical protein
VGVLNETKDTEREENSGESPEEAISQLIKAPPFPMDFSFLLK